MDIWWTQVLSVDNPQGTIPASIVEENRLIGWNLEGVIAIHADKKAVFWHHENVHWVSITFERAAMLCLSSSQSPTSHQDAGLGGTWWEVDTKSAQICSRGTWQRDECDICTRLCRVFHSGWKISSGEGREWQSMGEPLRLVWDWHTEMDRTGLSVSLNAMKELLHSFSIRSFRLQTMAPICSMGWRMSTKMTYYAQWGQRSWCFHFGGQGRTMVVNGSTFGAIRKMWPKSIKRLALACINRVAHFFYIPWVAQVIFSHTLEGYLEWA